MEKFFGAEEADRNFERNIYYRKTPSPDVHPVIQGIKSFPLPVSSVLEIGCGNGCVLARMRELMPNLIRLVGIDPSKKAVEFGNKNFEGIELFQADTSNFKEILDGQKFDLIVFGGVLFHVNPHTILQVLGDADSMLNVEGFMLFFDFYPQSSTSTKYKHEDELNIFKYDHQSIIESVPHFKKLFFKAVWSDEPYSGKTTYDLNTAHYISIHRKDSLATYNSVADPTI